MSTTLAIPVPGGSKKTFADMLISSTHSVASVSATGLNSNGPKQGLHRGKPAAFFPMPLLNSYAIPFKWALIGKFSQGRPRMEDINRFFVSLDLKGSFKLGLLDARHIVINFSVEEDFHRIFTRLTWNIYRWPMRVFKYTIDFHVNKESSIVPIWVNFERLPLVLFNKEALFAIASLIGHPLRSDTATIELKRPSVARVQVEVDLLKPILDTVWIGMGEDDGFWQEVKYENLLSYCAYCWHLGHSETHCLVKHPELKEVTKAKTQPDKAELKEVTKAKTQPDKVFRPKPAQVVEKTKIDDKKKSDEDKGEQLRTREKEDGWTTVSSRKVKNQSKGQASEKPISQLYAQQYDQVTEQQIGQLLGVSSKDVEDEFVADFFVAQEKGFPSHMMLQLMRTGPNDNQEKEASSSKKVEESNGQQLQQSQLHELNLSKAMVVYSQSQKEEFSTEVPEIPNIERFTEEEIQQLVQENISEATNELIENIADRGIKEDSPSSHKKSFAQVVSVRSPQAMEESSLQPLQCVFSPIPQVKDLTQKEIQNLVQEGIIIESSAIEPASEWEDNEDDDEHSVDGIDDQIRLIQSGNLSPRKSRGTSYSLRPRRKYNRYKDFYC